MNEPKFYLREYEPRKNNGIRGLSLRTEGTFGNAVFEGLHTPRSALRLIHNRRIVFCHAKKIPQIFAYMQNLLYLCSDFNLDEYA